MRCSGRRRMLASDDCSGKCDRECRSHDNSMLLTSADGRTELGFAAVAADEWLPTPKTPAAALASTFRAIKRASGKRTEGGAWHGDPFMGCPHGVKVLERTATSKNADPMKGDPVKSELRTPLTRSRGATEVHCSISVLLTSADHVSAGKPLTLNCASASLRETKKQQATPTSAAGECGDSALNSPKRAQFFPAHHKHDQSGHGWLSITVTTSRRGRATCPGSHRSFEKPSASSTPIPTSRRW